MRALRSLLQAVRPMLGLAGGLVMVGLSGYAYILAAAHAYPATTGSDPTSKLAVTGYYFLVTTILLGVYNGLDQVTNRRLAHTLATGAPLRPALLRAIRDAAGLTAGIGAILLAASPILVGKTLHDDIPLYGGVLVGIVFAACASVVRGVLAGSQRFGAYGAVWGAEGLSRIVLTAAVLVSGEKGTWLFGYAFVVPYLVSALVGLFFCRHMREAMQKVVAEDDDADPAASMGLVALATAGLLTTAVANLPQLILNSRVPSTDLFGVAFGQAFLLARIALTVLTPFQSMLLPAFTHEAALGHLDKLRTRLRVATLICAGVGALWAVLVVIGGPWAVRVLYANPASAVPSLLVFATLGGGTILFAVASAVQPAIVAVGRYRQVPAIWACGAAATALGAFWPGASSIHAATAAALVGPAAVLLAMAFALRGGLSVPAPAGAVRPTGEPAASTSLTRG